MFCFLPLDKSAKNEIVSYHKKYPQVFQEKLVVLNRVGVLIIIMVLQAEIDSI